MAGYEDFNRLSKICNHFVIHKKKKENHSDFADSLDSRTFWFHEVLLLLIFPIHALRDYLVPSSSEPLPFQPTSDDNVMT